VFRDNQALSDAVLLADSLVASVQAHGQVNLIIYTSR